MANILDYLVWRGDITFEERPLNEVDNLIFTELAYTEMEGIVPGIGKGETETIQKISEAYDKLGYSQKEVVNDPAPLLHLAAESPRFSQIRAGSYVNRIDPARALQFSAVTFYLPDYSLFVAYRGTDNSIAGWREDFNFSFEETPGQREAAAYLNEVAEDSNSPIFIGGHSKGGNLAIYAAAFCDGPVSSRIKKVYSNDGPGFTKNVIETKEYKAVLNRVIHIIPEASLVGMLLFNKAREKIVKSNASGVKQHDPYSWQVCGAAFEESEERTAYSKIVNETLARWLDSLNEQQRENLVTSIFDSLDATGAETITELKENGWESYSSVLKALQDIEPEKQKDVSASLLKLAETLKNVVWEGTKQGLDDILDRTKQNDDPASDRGEG